MARRRYTQGQRRFDHPDRRSYARTTGVWQGRSGQRNSEFATFSNLLGLNTAFDQMHRGDGESPYLRNVRYFGEKQTTQRAQVTSRSGARFLHSIGDVEIDPPANTSDLELEMYEGKSIEFEVPLVDLIVGGSLRVKNTEGATGALRVLLKESKDTTPLCDAIINLEEVSRLSFDLKKFRFIQGFKNLSHGTVTIRLEILDDVEPDRCQEQEPIEGRKIHILASSEANHRMGEYFNPNVNECLKEQDTTFVDQAGIPLFGTMTNGYETMARGFQYCCKGKEYLVYPIKAPNGDVELYREQLASGHKGGRCDCGPRKCKTEKVKGRKPEKLNAPVDKDACNVRFTEAGGHIYYVDGHSPLQRFPVCGKKAEIVCPEEDDIDTNPAFPVDPETLKPKEGASLVLFMKNRIYLSGFSDDPNYVEFSLIDGEGPKYEQYNESFYSPDVTPGDSVCEGITALSEFENNLIVWRRDGNSVFNAPQGLDFGTPQQVDTFMWNVGVAAQEHVDDGNNNIYFWNRSEGFRRFGGTDSAFQSVHVDNEMRRIGQDDYVFVMAHANKVRMWFDREDRGYADHQFVYHTALARTSPWYMDNQTPLMWAVSDQNSDTIYGMHGQYPATYIVDYHEEDDGQYTDFDSSIPMEYSTNYISPGGFAGYTHLRRVIVKVMRNSTNSWFIGVDKDHQDNPAVWRRFVTAQIDGDNNEDGVFGNTAEAGSETLNIFMRVKCREMQVRVKTYNYRSYSELMFIQGEYGGQGAL